MNNFGISKNVSRGYTLIEVLIGILIFAVGMMALAQLQGNLAQNSGDANARTVAMNLAEELIEMDRTFSVLAANGTDDAYEDITTLMNKPYERIGVQFKVDKVVSDYYHQADGTFSTTPRVGAAYSDFKKIELTVTWNESTEGAPRREFQIDGENSTTDGLGSGSITINEVVSSVTSGAGGKAALGAAASSMYEPPVDYNPGQNPDIVSISLGANKFKESTTPLPDVLRADELVETRFDVVTYSNPVDSSATFLRREEFRAVSCECTLKIPAGSGGGLRPTIWNGLEYDEGELVSKPYGVSASNQQSVFCDICCRDHHDGGSGNNDLVSDPGKALYNPFRSESDYHTEGGLAGDHKHYKRSANGTLAIAATDGDRYVEACRLVRKDGFFRVAQDLRQEGLNAFPGDYLDEEAEIGVYSKYVTDAVKNFESNMGIDNQYEGSPPTFLRPTEMSPAVVFPASTYGTATEMSAASGVTEQQLRSRGVYIDYMSDDLRCKINYFDTGNKSGDCEIPTNVSSSLEIIPFYDVQLTWLARWTETPSNNPVDVTNQAISNDNAHSRGIAMLTDGFGYSSIDTSVHNGNLGLTGTDPIDPYYRADEEDYFLYAKAVDFGTPPELSGITVAVSILSAVPGLKAADVEIVADGAQCNRTNTGFVCIVEFEASKPSLKVSNYDKAGKEVFACSAELDLQPPREHISLNGSGSWTNFSLAVPANVLTDIVIKEGGC